jgi:YVTN family beta-propeller protein
MRSSRVMAVCLCFLPFVLLSARSQSGGYHLLKKVSLSAAPGGGEYFDYLTFDPSARRVYLSHGTEVKVVDADSDQVVGIIPALKRCHGVALVGDLGKGFITDGSAAKVVIFDIATLKLTAEIKTEPDADSIIYDPASKRIFSFNGDSHSATVIDPAKGAVIKSIPLSGSPEFAAADGKGMVYDNIEDKNEVLAIDARALTIKARWPVAPAGGPTALALDPRHRRLFSSGRNPQMLVMMDADSGKVIQSFPISAGVDANVYDPESAMLFVSTREGMIHIFHEDSPDKLSEVEAVKTEYGAKTMAFDPKTHDLYLTTSDFTSTADAQQPNSRRTPVPGTFRLLIYGH